MQKGLTGVDRFKQQEDNLNFIIEATGLATWELNPFTKKFTGSNRFKEWFSLFSDEEIDLSDALKKIAEKDRQHVLDAIEKALQPGTQGHFDIEYDIINADNSLRRVIAKGKVIFNENNIAYRFSGILQDVTKERFVVEKLLEVEERTRIAVDSAMLGTFDVDFSTDKIINSKRLLEIFGFFDENTPHAELIKRIHPDDLHIRHKAYEDAKTTGNLFYEVRIIWPDGSQHWINAQAKVLQDENVKPKRLIGIVKDITEQKNMLAHLQESEKRFRDIVKQVPIGITIFHGNNFEVQMANETYLQVVDRKESEFVGKPLFEVLPEVKESVEPLLNEVFTTGTPFYGLEFPVTINRYGKKDATYFNFVYHPLRDEDNHIYGIIVVAMEVTESVKAKHELTESVKQFRNFIMQSPIPMAIFRTKDHVIELGNRVMFERMWRKKPEEVIGKKLLDVFPELHEQKYPELLNKVFSTGEPHRETESIAFVQGNDEMRKFFLDYEYAPLFETDNSVSGIMITVNDVTEKVEARHKIQEAQERARLAVNAGELGVYEIDLQTSELIADNRFFEIFGYENKVSWKNILDTIHEDDVAIRNEAQKKAMNYGLLDYEVRLRKKDASINWVKVKGKVVFEQETPVKLIGIAVDITKQKEFEAALENKVQERTEELAEAIKKLSQSNIELNQFAYIASHDLQEPLRKVRTFIGLMRTDLGEISDKTKNYISKIETSAERMQNLINDVLKFSSISTEREKFESVDLNIILNNVVNDYELLIEQKKAIIQAENLPVIQAIPLQMSQLFTNMISNALKFSDTDRRLEISITARQLSGKAFHDHFNLTEGDLYYQIDFKDNGIGFEQENAEQIFTIFQRLHGKTEYEGTGIGLAMCKKIVQNHRGVIYAESQLNRGACFSIILPKTQVD